MDCQNSKNILPKELIEQIQKYVDGKVIYIPKKQKNKKQWGENTDTKQVLASRNCQICLDRQNGMTIKQLSEKYFLTEKSIQRILRQEKCSLEMWHRVYVAHFSFKKEREVLH